ncbi:MAG: hypothetical protein OXH61_00460 [Acidimicrobiaceae bacterium]|nr:hypothetical protein [Acidimicrobiaceae bacterium]
MFIVCWSPKGGSGTSVVASALALTLASSGRETLLVDTVGDLGLVLGLPPGDGDGLSDWLLAPSDVSADALSLLEVPAGERLQLLGAGNATEAAINPERTVLAAELLSRSARWVVVDAGSTGAPEPWLVQGARSVMVLRACYLGIQAALARRLAPGTSIVVVEEPGRALRLADVTAVFNGHRVVSVPWDPAVSRAVDSGLLAHRMPRSLNRLNEVLNG